MPTETALSRRCDAALLAPRRLIEIVVDFALMCGSFFAAYYIIVGGFGQRRRARGVPRRAAGRARYPVPLLRPRGHLPTRLALRDDDRRARDRCRVRCVGVPLAGPSSTRSAARRVPAVGVSPRRDLRNGSGRRCPPRVSGLWSNGGTAAGREPTTSRVLIVGAGRLGRSYAREARETPGLRDRRIPRRQSRAPRAPDRRPARARPAQRDRAGALAERCHRGHRHDRRRTHERLAQLSAACADAGVTCTLMHRRLEPTRAGDRGRGGVSQARIVGVASDRSGSHY